ncbi:putative FTS and Hook-interacting protein [Hypsibius exemplaris]|uniref:FTS and Hook-interacting protein n=1 Tax=Hypsibius exemplaris TaxID=2072580 RepID=A0A9X6NHK2_HYPEX|nr:putative FTS and Hook-interacting protein [Hypsibius exemplaris]
MTQRPRKLSSVEESRHTALENVKKTWIEIDHLLAPLSADVILGDDAGARRSSLSSHSVVPQIVLDLMSQHVLDKLNRLFDKVISSLAAAVARIQLRNSPSPSWECMDADLGQSIMSPPATTVPSGNQVILLEDDVLEYVIEQNILIRTLGYSIHPLCPDAAALQLRWNLLRIFETLVSSCLKDPRLLSHESILVPLLGLFDVCTGKRDEQTDRKMMAVMNELTYCLKQAPDLLPFFVEVEPEVADAPSKEIRDLRILSYLYPHIHNSGETGQLARSAVLAVLRIIQSEDDLNRHVAEKSDFCGILVSGLCAFYLSLPHKCFSAFSPGWHRINPYDVTCSLELQHFTEYVEFCNAVMKLSHPVVQEEFTKRFRNHFLLPVVTQALTQFSDEEVMAATAYFDYILRTLEDSRLRACIFAYLVGTSSGERNIMDHLVGNILHASSRLSTVTLAFFQTLLDMNYEPLLDYLILRFLNEARPFLSTSNDDGDVFDDLALAQELLQLIPAACQLLDFDLDSGVGTGEPAASPSALKKFFGKKSSERPAPVESPREPPLTLPAYTDYLLAARCKLKECWEACAAATDGDRERDSLTAISVRKTISLFPDLELHGVNFVGPFVASLLFRLDHLLDDQNIYLSLQLTGLISRLLVYPHPQIWNFLFSRNDNVQESGKFLLQILTTLKTAIDLIIPKSNLGKAVIKRTYRTLLLRTVKADSPTFENGPAGSQHLLSPADKSPSKMSGFFGRKSPTETPEETVVNSIFTEASAAIPESVEFSSTSPRYRRGSVITANTPDAGRMRHAAYAAVILSEFSQELAAICQERVLRTLLPSPTD